MRVSIIIAAVVACTLLVAVSAQPFVQQQPTFNVNPAMFQQQQPLAFNPYQQQFGLGAIGQAQQPIYQQPIYPTIGANQPLAWGGAANVQQPITLGGYGAIPAGAATAMPLGYGASTTIPAVLPQNFGNPSAAYGTLGAPVLSPQQVEKLKRTSLQQVVPTAQLQAALDQRVASFGQPIGNIGRV